MTNLLQDVHYSIKPAVVQADRAQAVGMGHRVVLVDSELPYPANCGKRIRTLNLATRLAKRHQLTFICHRNSDPEEAKQAAAYLAAHGIASVVVDRAVPAKKGPLFYCRLAANLLSPLPYSVATHTSKALRRALQNHAAHNQVDIWQCEWTPYADALRSVSGPLVVHTQNVEASIWRRYHETESTALKRWYIKHQWHKFARFERDALATADRTIAVSDGDAQVMRGEYGVARVDVVENGVDTAYFHPGHQPRDPRRLLFLGSLDWRPNIDAVNQLIDTIFPAIRAAQPDARLVIVGRNASTNLRDRLAALPGAELHSNVPDVRPYLASCTMLVVPLRIGGGSRIKILEALASELPVVTTSVGAEGLDLAPDAHLTVVDSVAEIGPAVLKAMHNPADMADQAKRGRQEVVTKYDWNGLATRLESVWDACVALARQNTGTNANVRQVVKHL
jgi:glycosyltransferase involved in cell wall biosynthesis